VTSVEVCIVIQDSDLCELLHSAAIAIRRSLKLIEGSDRCCFDVRLRIRRGGFRLKARDPEFESSPELRQGES
jgi:hypothetical protein